jgi:hypothetical protein
LKYATHKHVKRRIQVQIEGKIDSKSLMFRIFIPDGNALICTEFDQVNKHYSCPGFFAVSMPGFVQVCSRVSGRLSKRFEESIKKDSQKLTKNIIKLANEACNRCKNITCKVRTIIGT